jgi:hypothetical protein
VGRITFEYGSFPDPLLSGPVDSSGPRFLTQPQLTLMSVSRNYAKAPIPVMSRPTISVWIVSVPS